MYALPQHKPGVALDRLGPRKFMTAGVILLTVAITACSLTSQIWHLYILFGVLVSVPMAMCSTLPWYLAGSLICLWIASPCWVRLVAGKAPKAALELGS